MPIIQLHTAGHPSYPDLGFAAFVIPEHFTKSSPYMDLAFQVSHLLKGLLHATLMSFSTAMLRRGCV